MKTARGNGPNLNQLECECDALSIHFSADKDQILRSLHLLHKPNSVVELRMPGIEYGTKAGYFNDWTKLADAAVQYSGHCPGIYVTVNPLDPRLLYRAANHVTKLKNTTADADILCRRWLPIDFDPVRPAGISSTDKEHELALARARECRAYVIGEGWPEPLLADSGNGAHLLCRIDLPNDDASRDLVKRVLVSLGRRFTDDQVAVDPLERWCARSPFVRCLKLGRVGLALTHDRDFARVLISMVCILAATGHCLAKVRSIAKGASIMIIDP